jgi:hypothetical protein
LHRARVHDEHTLSRAPHFGYDGLKDFGIGGVGATVLRRGDRSPGSSDLYEEED